MCHSQAVSISCFFIDQSGCFLHLGSPDVSAPFLRSEERSQIIVSTDEMLLIRSLSANWNFLNNIKKMAHLKTLKMKILSWATQDNWGPTSHKYSFKSKKGMCEFEKDKQSGGEMHLLCHINGRIFH